MDFYDVVEKAKQGFDVVCKKTEDVVGISKMRIDQAAIESKLSKSYEILGKICYDAVLHDEDFDSESVKPIIDDISEKLECIAKLKKDIAAAQNKKQCPKCSNAVDKDSAFCNKCGAKVD